MRVKTKQTIDDSAKVDELVYRGSIKREETKTKYLKRWRRMGAPTRQGEGMV